MSVYVDPLRRISPPGTDCFPFPTCEACHLMADDQGELDTFALRIGFKSAWKHRDHYDLTPRKRRAAVKAGAIETTAYHLVCLRKIERDRHG